MATIYDAKRRARVTAATVSYIVNGKRKVGEETRARVPAGLSPASFEDSALGARALPLLTTSTGSTGDLASASVELLRRLPLVEAPEIARRPHPSHTPILPSLVVRRSPVSIRGSPVAPGPPALAPMD